MLHTTGLWHGNRDVNRSWHHRDVYCRANALRIVHAVLQANHGRIRPNKWRHLCRRRRCIVRFPAKKNQRAIANRAHVGSRLRRDLLMGLRSVQNETVRTDRVSEMLAPDEDNRRTGAGEHATKVPTDRTRAHHRDSWPFLCLCHRLVPFSVTHIVPDMYARVSTDRNSGFELRNLNDGTNSRSKWNRLKAPSTWNQPTTSVRLMARRSIFTRYFRWSSKVARNATECGWSKMNCES